MNRLNTLFKLFLLHHVYNWHIFHVLSHGRMRVAILRYCGAKIGNGVYLSPYVFYDNHLEYLTIEDNVLISPKAIFIFHKRNLIDFNYGSEYLKVPHIMKPIKIGRNAVIGTGAIILPGVTIGEGACVGAGAVVSRDVTPWTVVAGNPAKVIKQFVRYES